jgi:hypothetical protein
VRHPYLPSMIGLTPGSYRSAAANAYCMPPPECGALTAPRSASAALRIFKISAPKPPPHDPSR